MTDRNLVKGPNPQGATPPGRVPQEPNGLPGQPPSRPEDGQAGSGRPSPDDPAVPTALDPLDSPQHKPMLNE